MLESLPDLLKSQFFLSEFKHHLGMYLEENSLDVEVGLSTIHSRIYTPSFEFVSITISDLFSHDILTSTINKHFARYTNCTELMRAEIIHIITAIEGTSETSYRSTLDETMQRVDIYFSLQRSQNIAVQVLEVRDSYGFTGGFANTQFISNFERVDSGTTQLKLVTPELLKTTGSLANFNQTHVNILLTLLECVNLFTWTARILKKPSDLDDFIDLALNSVDNTAVQINRITCFKTVCIIFSPFPFQHQDIDEIKFLQNLQEVYDNVRNRDESDDYLLKMSQDCARVSEVTFWRQIQFSYTSIEGKIISQLQQILRYGKFVLTTTMDMCTVEDVLKLYVTSYQLVNTQSVYNIDELREMQSKIALITPLMHEDKDVTRFLPYLQDIMTLVNLVLQLHCSGNAFFMDRTLEYTCHSINTVKEDIYFLRKAHYEWNNEILQARKKHYYLNYFTNSQIFTIRIALRNICRHKDLNRDTTHLLTLIRADISQVDIEGALGTLRRSSDSFNSPTESINSFLDYAGDVGSSTFSNYSLMGSSEESPPSIQLVDQNTSIKYLYANKDPSVIPLEDLGLFLYKINSCNGPLVDRSFPKCFRVNEPNLIFSKYSDIIYTILSLYFNSDSRSELPSPHEVLICSYETTSEEIDIFWRRCVM